MACRSIAFALGSIVDPAFRPRKREHRGRFRESIPAKIRHRNRCSIRSINSGDEAAPPIWICRMLEMS